MKPRLLIIACLLLTTFPVSAGPLVARFQSVLGGFDVLLDPLAAPQSVKNFSAYANRGAYDTSIIHRSTTYYPPGIQIVQGGGFELVGNTIEPVATDLPIPLEAGVANTQGTLAMARTTQPNSATSQWYFNVQSNPGLDFNYAVFGRVMGTGMSVVNAIGQVAVYNASQDLGGAFGELPLLADSLAVQNLVLINSVRVAPLAITNITRIGNTTKLLWLALSSNTPVRVERTTDLNGSWAIVANGLKTGEFTDTSSLAGSAFYRLVTE